MIWVSHWTNCPSERHPSLLILLNHTYVQRRSHLTLSWRGPLSYRNQSIDLQSKANQWTGFYMITASVIKELKVFQLYLESHRTPRKASILWRYIQLNTITDVFLCILQKFNITILSTVNIITWDLSNSSKINPQLKMSKKKKLTHEKLRFQNIFRFLKLSYSFVIIHGRHIVYILI